MNGSTEQTVAQSTDFIRVDEVMTRMAVSQSKAYAIMKSLNKELQVKGFLTVAGRVPRRYFEERTYV